eukprot:7667751-Pyramimonas_sp.AAC.1
MTASRNSKRFTLRMCGTLSASTVVSMMPKVWPRHSGKRMTLITRAAPPTPWAALSGRSA